MSTLTLAELDDLLSPYGRYSDTVLAQLSTYLDLLVKWNARTNLTGIRDPRVMVTRHFGESLFTARHVPPCKTLLDFGSGAGFPGLPIQLMWPEIQVTLAESQGKKASFLLEVIRALDLRSEVWSGRVEDMAVGRRFDVVTLRAVDRPKEALTEARRRARFGGLVMSLSSRHANTGPHVLLPGAERTTLELIQVAEEPFSSKEGEC